jgi:hypothetical protein
VGNPALRMTAFQVPEGVLTMVAIGSRWVCACGHCTESVPKGKSCTEKTKKPTGWLA